MENAIDALKMAFAVIVFVGALGLAIIVFGQARATSEAVLYMKDNTNFYEYTEGTNYEERIVGIETIIPTLYRYYKENYSVVFKDANGKEMEIYQTKNKKWINANNGKTWIGTFDIKEESKRGEPWVGATEDYKKNLDAFISGGIFKYTDGTDNEIDYEEENLNKYKDRKFKESIGEYQYDKASDGTVNEVTGVINVDGEEIELVKKETKRIIIYTLINE